MSVRKDTLWESFLKPIVLSFLDKEELRRFYESKDWEAESDRFRQPNLTYPEYYRSQNFHGIESGYLNSGAAVSYDPITQYALPPNETWIRQDAINSIGGEPRRILDLGCGTGSTTFLLEKAFPRAEIVGLDLSPYMLVMAAHKAAVAGSKIHWQHGLAEATGFADASFDLVTASLLFHETPERISRAILQEAFRLLKPNGQVMILDGNQKLLRHNDWLTNVFEEPYIKEYARGSVDAWMGAIGFEAVQTQDIWLVHQVSRGIKPLASAPVLTIGDAFPEAIEGFAPA